MLSAALSALESANLHDVIMLGSLTLSAILFADDVVLLTRAYVVDRAWVPNERHGVLKYVLKTKFDIF